MDRDITLWTYIGTIFPLSSPAAGKRLLEMSLDRAEGTLPISARSILLMMSPLLDIGDTGGGGRYGVGEENTSGVRR
jgi:hypothetical protein